MNKRLVAIDGPLKGLILDLEDKDSYVIGRDEDQVDLVLKDLTVSRRHVFLQKDDDGIFIENLSKTNPIMVNDEVLTDKEILHENDEIKIGENIFVYLYHKNEKTEGKEELFDTIFDENEQKEPNSEEPIKPKNQDITTYYDTIFEDSEDSLSFNLIDENQFILKVVAGPNTGAEFGMDKNKQYVLGKDTRSCDIVFNDLSVSKKHAKLTIDENDNVSIQDLKSKNKTFVNNEEVKGVISITSNDLVTIGTTTFLVVKSNEDLHTIYAQIPERKEKISEQKEEVIETEKIEEEIVKEPIKEEKQSEWKDIIIPTNHLLLGGSFILIVFVIFLSFFSLFKGKHIDIVKPNISSNIKNLLKKYESIEYNFNDYNENLFLVGHILTELDHEELIYSLKQLSSIKNINDNIIVDELIWKNINKILNDNESYKGINIYAIAPGKFIMQGYVQNVKQNEALLEYINVNFQYADKLENKVIVEQVLQMQVGKIILINKFEGIKFQLNNGDLILMGQYNKEHENKLEKMILELKKLNGIRQISNLATPGSSDSAKIDISDKYNVTGYASFDDENVSIVINGHIVSIGSLLDDMKIIDIQPHIVLLEKDGLGYKINYSY